MVQLGGLGIMTYSSLILVLLGQKLSFRGGVLTMRSLHKPLGDF